MPSTSAMQRERSEQQPSYEELLEQQRAADAAKMHARALGAVDFETQRVQALGAKKMREEAWIADYRRRIKVYTLGWRPIVPRWLRKYLKNGLHMRKLVAAILMRRVFTL